MGIPGLFTFSDYVMISLSLVLMWRTCEMRDFQTVVSFYFRFRKDHLVCLKDDVRDDIHFVTLLQSGTVFHLRGGGVSVKFWIFHFFVGLIFYLTAKTFHIRIPLLTIEIWHQKRYTADFSH